MTGVGFMMIKTFESEFNLDELDFSFGTEIEPIMRSVDNGLSNFGLCASIQLLLSESYCIIDLWPPKNLQEIIMS